MEVIIQPDAPAVAEVAARIFAAQVRARPQSVLGLATGSTPLGLYRRLVAMVQEGGLSFAEVKTFNLDEYIGLGPEHEQSYAHFMRVNFFTPAGLRPEQSRLPNGLTTDVPGEGAAYEAAIRAAGGIDLQLLGLGANGHIGFNEPSSSLASRTRLKTLAQKTIEDNARFFANPAEVPRHVITMGIGTISEARHCLVLALGEAKAAAVAAMVEGPITANCPASVLQLHPRCTLIVDEGAAQSLQRADYYRWVYDNKPGWQQI